MEPHESISNDYNDLIAQIRNSVKDHKKVILDKFIFLEHLGVGNYGDVYKTIHS